MSLNTVPFNPFPPSSDQKGSGGGGSYVLPAATDETLGGIKVGDNLTVEEDGTLNAPDPYTLPIAEDDTLGGVKVGSGLSIDSETGALSADRQIVDYSTTEQATGQTWIDGSNIYRVVLSLESAITINANTWSSDIDFVGDKIISVSVMNSTDNNVFPVGGNIANDKLSILNPRSSAITINTIIVEYTKTETEE